MEVEAMTKSVVVFFLAASLPVLAQSQTGSVTYRGQVSGVAALAPGGAGEAPVTNAPYSATIGIESIQTLPDGNRIVQNLTGSIARDSEGRTRSEPPAPADPNAPRMVLLQDPVAKTAYMLDFKNKTAQKIMTPSASGTRGASKDARDPSVPIVESFATPGPGVVVSVRGGPSVAGQTSTEDLGSQTMEGLLVTGKRITRTIPAGEIGNAEPITIVTEEWTSPDLKTVVYSKTDDPASGVQIYRLTNISRNEPDPSLFTIPSDFKIISGSPGAITTGSGQN
jgi:hypothetical protein